MEELKEKVELLKIKYKNIDWKKQDEFLAREFMLNAMFLASSYGNQFFSLQQKDLEDYLTNISYLFCECCHLKTNLFEESYETFLNFVKDEICMTKIGNYEPWNAGIRINRNKEVTEKYLNCLKPFDDIVRVASEFFLQEVPTMYLKMSKSV